MVCNTWYVEASSARIANTTSFGMNSLGYPSDPETAPSEIGRTAGQVTMAAGDAVTAPVADGSEREGAGVTAAGDAVHASSSERSPRIADLDTADTPSCAPAD